MSDAAAEDEHAFDPDLAWGVGGWVRHEGCPVALDAGQTVATHSTTFHDRPVTTRPPESLPDSAATDSCAAASPLGSPPPTQGFASGYYQGWDDAKSGRVYGATPAANAPKKAGAAGAHDATSGEVAP